MSWADLVTLGNLTVDDIVFWPDGRTFMGQPGGDALFAALGARIWLPRVGLLTRVGSDYPAERLREIEARGVCLGLVHSDRPTLHDWALYEADGARQFINHLSSGTNVEMTLEPDEIGPEHLDARAYHLAPVPAQLLVRTARRLKRPGNLVSVDPYYPDIADLAAELEALLRATDFFLPSQFEARLLFGADDPPRAAQAFGRLGPQAVAIKLGQEGSLIYESGSGLGRVTHVPIYPATLVDPTGAGDAYCGGFLAGYLLTGSAAAAAQHGTISASYVVEAVGALATQQPTPADAAARLAHVAARTTTQVEGQAT